MTKKKEIVSKVDVENPTLLFKQIQEGDIDSAIARTKSNPEECKIWIVSRYKDEGKYTDQSRSKGGDRTLWEFLPLHLVCIAIQHLNINGGDGFCSKYLKLKQLVFAIVQTYPKCIVLKDHDGNLPIHILLQPADGVKFDEELFNLLMDRKFKNYKAKDAFGISIFGRFDINRNSFCDQIFDTCNDQKSTGFYERGLMKWIKKLDKLQGTNQKTQYRDDHCDGTERQLDFTSSRNVERLDTMVSTLQLECSSKDDKIDSLSVQIDCLKSKIKGMQKSIDNTNIMNGAQKHFSEWDADSSLCHTLPSSFHENNEYKQSSTSSYDLLKEENGALKAKIELDSRIVANQEETIENLRHQIQLSKVEKEANEMKIEQTKNQLMQMKLELDTNNDSIEHLRQITDVLQKEIASKDDEIEKLKSVVAESNQREQILECAVQEKDKEIERNVVTLQSDLKEQSHILKRFVESLDRKDTYVSTFVESSANGSTGRINELYVENMNGEQEIKEKIKVEDDTKKDNIEIEERKSPIKHEVRFDESSSDNSSYVYYQQNNNSSECTNSDGSGDDKSGADIRERQIRLRKDLKHIYNQIKNVMPPKDPPNEDDQNEEKELSYKKAHYNNFFHEQVTPKHRQRPWYNDHENIVLSPRTKASAAELGAKILGRV